MVIEMVYIFWNTKNEEKINDYVEKIIEEYSPDFFGLAEYSADGFFLQNKLKKKGLEYAYIPRISSRLDMFYKGKVKEIIHCADSKYYTVKIMPYEKQSQIISIVHLPSKMYSDLSGNAEIVHDMLEDIKRIKEKKNINGVVIVGDFNMNPFESPMIEATALQAISSRKIVVEKKMRVYKDRNREFFYNPMWNFLGDEKFPIGSYYYKSASNSALFWNTFDQFIVNNIFANKVILEKIKFIDTVSDLPLYNRNGKPTVSDHFPLYFEIGERR